MFIRASRRRARFCASKGSGSLKATSPAYFTTSSSTSGDIYPCDFFVEKDRELGHMIVDSWPEITLRQRRYHFAANKTIAHPECQVCEYQAICHGGCPRHRHDPRWNFQDLDYFCAAY